MTGGHPNDRLYLGLLALVAFGAVGLALVSQHVYDMQPCPWCIVQRMLFCVVGLVAWIAAIWPLKRARTVHGTASLIVVTGCVLGAASALWQAVYAAKSSSCLRTTADLIIGFTQLDRVLPDIFQARASCADASMPLMGIPYPIWSLLLFLGMAVAAFKMHIDQRHRVVIRSSMFGQTA